MDQIEKFKKSLADHGLDPGEILTDGIIHRFSTQSDRSGETSGAYWHNGNVGWYQDWRTMERPRVIKGTLSEADKLALDGSFNGNGQKVSRKVLEEGIRKIWNNGEKPDGHPYLSKKQIPAVPEVKQYDGKLIIPLFGINGELNGLQRIDVDGSKRFLAGSRKKGSFFSIVGDETIVVCEGFATGVSIHQATGFSVAVAFDAGNLLPVAKKMCSKVGSDKVIVAGDNDKWKTVKRQRNTGAKAAKTAGAATGARVVLPEFQSPDNNRTTDFNDLYIAENADMVRAQIKSAQVDKTQNGGAKGGESFFNKIEGCTAMVLMDMEFPNPRWVIEGIVPEGVFVFAGKPKAGKSVMALNISVAVATGGKYLERDVEKGPVIYLHLEDNQRRIQTRLKAMIPIDDYSGKQVTGIENLHLYYKWPRIGEGGLRALELFCNEHKPRLIIIDTMKMFQPNLTKVDHRKVQSEIDYERIIALRPLAEKFNTTIMIVTHTRKMGADDPIDLISGTLGTAGASDNFLVLYERKGVRAKLWVQGRDVDQQEYIIEYNKPIWTWMMLGESKNVVATDRQQAVLDYIMEFGSEKEPVTPTQIITGSGVKKDYVNGKILPMLVKENLIQKAGRGKYYVS